jgi:hypothetical protein
VFPDGAATRLTYGVLNLTHRDGHEDLKALKPGERYKVRIQLNECGERIGAGNRLRLAISSAYWPIVWPSPQPVTLTVRAGVSTLELPVRPEREEDARLRAFEPAENAPALRASQVRPGESHIEMKRNIRTGRVDVERYQDDGLVRIEDFDWQTGTSARRIYSIAPDDPLSAEVGIEWKKEYGRGDFRVRVDARTRMRAAEREFLLDGTLDTYEGETRVFSKEWSCRVPRDHV